MEIKTETLKKYPKNYKDAKKKHYEVETRNKAQTSKTENQRELLFNYTA